jgi:hypothetical protein
MAPKPVFLIWGGEGWVAGHLKTLLESQGTLRSARIGGLGS